MEGVEVAMQAWKEWGLQALVLLSLTVQVALLVLAELRRHIDSGALMAFVWSAYMLADATAIYVLGHLSVTSRSAEQELLALWAPFLLVHLGGQDNITAYALEDNKLWPRHLQTFVAQVAAAAYIIYGSSIIVGERWSMLLLVTILVFFVGLVKYGERVWALMRAGSSPTGNYRGRRRGGGEVSDSHISECPWVPESLKRRHLDSEALLLKAHLLLDFAKDVFKGPLSRIALYGTTPAAAGPGLEAGEEVYKMVEMQVSLVHDLFYTKAEVTHTWYGLCIRMLSWLAIGVAFLLFNIVLLCDDHHRKLKSSYSRVDVVVTYVLFVGAVVLESTSLVRAMLSSWTCALLLKRSSGSKRIAASSACTFVAGVILYLRRLVRAADLRRRCSWSRCMGQHNLVQFCVRSRSSRIRRVAKWVGVENWWNMQAYSWSVPVSACIKQLLLKRIKAMPEAREEDEEEEEEMQEAQPQEEEEEEEEEESSASDSSQRAVPEARQWGREALMNRGLYENLAGCVKFNKLDESILVWHIATDVYLGCWHKDQQEQANPPDDDGGGGDRRQLPADLAEAAQALSNYMLFLLAARPHMLPPDGSGDAYGELTECLTTCVDCSSGEELRRLLRRYEDLPGNGIRFNKSLERGCEIGKFLVGRRLYSPACDTLEMICEVWVEMLCYVGHGCGRESHAKQLSGGGELLTVVALVARYMTSPNLRRLVSASTQSNLQHLQSV